MKKRYKWNPLILLKNLFILAMIIGFVYLAVCYCEILIKNTSIDTRPIYSTWNFFTMWD